MARKVRLAVCISGTGRSLNNFIRRIEDGSLPAEIGLVISSSPNAKGLQYAEEEDLPIEIIERASFDDRASFSEATFNACRNAYVDYVALAGYLSYLDLPEDFNGKVLNIHPSLIPSFCGQGHYGNIVHAKALEYGVKVSGCTVHFLDHGYDTGPIILQKAVDVLEGDTPDMLNDRVFAAECIAYPEAIKLLAENRITVEGRLVRIAPPHDELLEDENI